MNLSGLLSALSGEGSCEGGRVPSPGRRRVSVWDGQTVVLGGLMREDVQKVEDKTPIIGDISLIGRAFRTNVDQHIKKNLVIFVTARVITPAGLAFNNEEEEEEGLLPPALPEVPAYKK